jgi:Fe-S-cluster containining protein
VAGGLQLHCLMAVPDCMSCGTCCFSELEKFVRVLGDDHERLGGQAEALVAFVGNRAYMKMVDGHCAALRVGGSQGRFVCTAYEARPQICRDLQRGSPECLGEIGSKEVRPLLALRRASPANPGRD